MLDLVPRVLPAPRRPASGYMPVAKTTEWGTPAAVFAALHERHHFTVDAAASAANHLLPHYWTIADDGLSQIWRGERVYCNPPYGREIILWVAKAHRAVRNGCPLAVLLLPNRTDTRWFHEYILGQHRVSFIQGRLTFRGATAAAPFGSMIITFAPPED